MQLDFTIASLRRLDSQRIQLYVVTGSKRTRLFIERLMVLLARMSDDDNNIPLMHIIC